jgi:ubiquinone/menaquinone biosynthesis C-methylase UbiE
LQEIKRVLKPSGKLLMVNEMVRNGVYEIKHAKMIEQAHVQLIPLEEIRNILQSVGLASVQIFSKANSSWNAILAQRP